MKKTVIIKSKLRCLLWCIKNGISKPGRYSFHRWWKSNKKGHNRFSYIKFNLCDSVLSAEQTQRDSDYYEIEGYEFHKDLLVIVNI